jgi:hypothetical protein
MSIVPAFRRQRQEDYEFKASPGYTARSWKERRKRGREGGRKEWILSENPKLKGLAQQMLIKGAFKNTHQDKK